MTGPLTMLYVRLTALLLVVGTMGMVSSLTAAQREDEAQQAHEARPVLKSNLELMQEGVQELTREMLQGARLKPGDSVVVRVQTLPEAWIVEQGIDAVLKAEGVIVFSPPDTVLPAPYLLSVPAMRLEVHYQNKFQDGIFGMERIGRDVLVEFSHQLKNVVTGEIRSSGVLSKQYADTVEVDNVGSIENDSMSVTHGELPSRALLDRLIEPFVIIGATGIAIYLLFHVRS